MRLESDHPITKNTPLMASLSLVITVSNKDMWRLIAASLEEAFLRVEEIQVERWEEEVNALMQSTWKEKTTKDPL